ncbi:MAG: hypothetical protein WBV94_21865 [Blastocatellia bacterium]
MLANRILDLILSVIALPVVLVQFVTTFVLGLLVSLSFGLLLWPISFVWMLFLAPLLGLSWVCSKLPLLRNILGIIGIPLALLADVYVSLMPSMGELENRASKMLLCQTWPFTWVFWRFLSGDLDLFSPNAHELNVIIARLTKRDPVLYQTVHRIINREPLDPHV